MEIQPQKEPIRWVIIGMGHIGKRHASHIWAEERAEIAAFVDLKRREELGLASEWAEVPLFHSLEEFLQAGIDYDLCSICTPNGLHATHASTILEEGRQVLVEKPLVLRPEEGILLRELSLKGRIYSVLQNRYTPTSLWLKELIDSQKLGKIYRVEMQCLWNRDERYYTPHSWHGDPELDGGTLYTQWAHFIDLLLWWLGPLEINSVDLANHAHQRLTPFEDTIDCHFTAGSTRGHLFASTAVKNRNRGISFLLLSEHATIELGGAYLNELNFFEADFSYPLPKQTLLEGNHYGAYSGSAANHRHVIRDVLNSLEGRANTAVGLDEGLAVVETIQKIYDKAKDE